MYDAPAQNPGSSEDDGNQNDEAVAKRKRFAHARSGERNVERNRQRGWMECENARRAVLSDCSQPRKCDARPDASGGCGQSDASENAPFACA